MDLSGSGGSGRATSWHSWHYLQNVSAALSIAGHHTLLLRFCFVPTIPKCHSRAWATACGLSLFGRTIRVPLKLTFNFHTVHLLEVCKPYIAQNDQF